ncbi:hypothetical protein Hdeb2414_s0013g00413821 [Helianthus debilis subsp. tardiflorus]
MMNRDGLQGLETPEICDSQAAHSRPKCDSSRSPGCDSRPCILESRPPLSRLSCLRVIGPRLVGLSVDWAACVSVTVCLRKR